jgi:hypothetical protein
MATVQQLLDSDRKRCFVLIQSKPGPEENTFLVAMVFEGEKGYFPMSGQGEHASPWYWNQETCDRENERRYQVSPEEAFRIQGTTF